MKLPSSISLFKIVSSSNNFTPHVGIQCNKFNEQWQKLGVFTSKYRDHLFSNNLNISELELAKKEYMFSQSLQKSFKANDSGSQFFEYRQMSSIRSMEQSLLSTQDVMTELSPQIMYSSSGPVFCNMCIFGILAVALH